MTLDERLEALTRSLELLSSLHRDSEKRTEQRMDQMAQRMDQVMDAMSRNEKRMGQMMDAITRLARIADVHQDRLDDHGERLERLEGETPGPAEGGQRRS